MDDANNITFSNMQGILLRYCEDQRRQDGKKMKRIGNQRRKRTQARRRHSIADIHRDRRDIYFQRAYQMSYL